MSEQNCCMLPPCWGCPRCLAASTGQISKCATCDYRWWPGSNGDHSCVEMLLKKVEVLLAENRKLKFMIDEGLGWEDMQQDSMQSHIN